MDVLLPDNKTVKMAFLPVLTRGRTLCITPHTHLSSSAWWTIKVTRGCSGTPCLEAWASEMKSSPRSAQVHRPPAICLSDGVVSYEVHPSPALILLLSCTFSILTGATECSHMAFAKGKREADLQGHPIPPHLTLSLYLPCLFTVGFLSLWVWRSPRQRRITRNSGDTKALIKRGRRKGKAQPRALLTPFLRPFIRGTRTS